MNEGKGKKVKENHFYNKAPKQIHYSDNVIMSFSGWSGRQFEAFLQEHLSVSYQILPPLVNNDELYMEK